MAAQDRASPFKLLAEEEGVITWYYHGSNIISVSHNVCLPAMIIMSFIVITEVGVSASDKFGTERGYYFVKNQSYKNGGERAPSVHLLVHGLSVPMPIHHFVEDCVKSDIEEGD